MQSTLKKTNIFIKIEYALLSKGHPKPRLLHLDVLFPEHFSCFESASCLRFFDSPPRPRTYKDKDSKC